MDDDNDSKDNGDNVASLDDNVAEGADIWPDVSGQLQLTDGRHIWNISTVQ